MCTSVEILLGFMILWLLWFLQGQMKLERQQILSLFIKVMKKFYKYLHSVASKEIESTLPRLREVKMAPKKSFFFSNK